MQIYRYTKTCKPTETFNNNQSNISIDDYCSTHDTSFDDSPLVEQSSSNDTECETNMIDENAVSNQDENMMPEIQDPNNFFEDDWYNLLPNSDLLKQQYTFSQRKFLWTQNDIVQVSLLKLLHEIQAPLYVFDQIMTWAADAQLSGYTFRTSFRHRKKLMTALYDRLDIHGLKPKKKTYRTHDGTNDEVIIFDFRQSLLSLLRDTSLMTDDNMLFTGTSPYDSIDENNDDYSDINSSERYAQIQSYKPLQPDEVRIPLILYVDKANIDEKGTINFEPLMYTLGWWNNATRKLPEAWRCLGLINDLDKKSKESKKAKPADKACNYQSAVGAIVESLVYVQKEDGILYDLKYKNNIYRCRLTFVVQFLSGDIKASDQMCGRLGGHNI